MLGAGNAFCNSNICRRLRHAWAFTMTSSLHYRLTGSRVVFALYFTSRYPVGALFSPHSDDEALTVNVLLDDHGMFKGGVPVPGVSSDTAIIAELVIRLHHQLAGLTSDKLLAKAKESRDVRLCGSGNEYNPCHV